MLRLLGKICFAAALPVCAGAAMADSATGAKAESAAADLPVCVWGTAQATVKQSAARGSLAGAMAAPAGADSLTGSCNAPLIARYIDSTYNSYVPLDCDAKGELKLNGKTYQVFEYQTAGYGEVDLSVMEPGFTAEPKNHKHILSAEIDGTKVTHNASLADSTEFTISLGDAGQDQKVTGKCEDKSYGGAGPRPKGLEDCDGPNWSLHIDTVRSQSSGSCNSRLNADAIKGGYDFSSEAWRSAWYLDCDAEGELKLHGKTYQVFEYRNSGDGWVSLGMMEPGFEPDFYSGEHVVVLSIMGENSSHTAGLADSRKFIIDFGYHKETLPGKCLNLFNAKGERKGKVLESCEGPGWSLHLTGAY